MSKKRRGVFLIILVLLLTALAAASPVLAQSVAPGESIDYTQLLPVALTLFLPVGTILLVSSAMPQERAPKTAINLLIVWSVSALAYFVVGFAFNFGGIAQVSPNPEFGGLYWEWYPLDHSVDVDVARMWGVVALRGWMLSAEASTSAALLLFLSHISLVGVAAMIPAGVLARRERWGTAIISGLLVGTLVYPLVSNWVWGGGWLSNLGGSLGLGHGFVDFGGAGVVFLTGSTVALVALIVFRKKEPKAGAGNEDTEVVLAPGAGKRLTVYEENSETTEDASLLQTVPMPSAHLPVLSMLGGGLLLVGWFGLATGVHMPTAQNFLPSLAATNGLLAALGAALTAATYSWFATRTVNALMAVRGLAAGLIVAIAAAPFAPAWIFVVVGLIMGLLVPLLIYLFDQKLPLSDRLGTVTTYGLSAILGLFLVGFFAGGQSGQGWNGVGIEAYLGAAGQGVSGLVAAAGFVSDWPGQFQAQLLGVGVILLWAGLLAFILFQTVVAITDAWARTGLELSPPSLPRAASTLPASDEASPEEQFNSQ